MRQFRNVLKYVLSLECGICSEIVRNSDVKDVRTCLLGRFDGKVLARTPQGAARAENIRTKQWMEWYPGLDNGERTLGEVYDALPGLDAHHIPFISVCLRTPRVRFLFEEP